VILTWIPALSSGAGTVGRFGRIESVRNDRQVISAGGDVMQAMKNKECGEAEIQEVVCVLVSLRDQVVIDADKKVQ
jgi:hypothetical protein